MARKDERAEVRKAATAATSAATLRPVALDRSEFIDI